MSTNQIQLYPGLPMSGVLRNYRTEAQFEQALEAVRRSNGVAAAPRITCFEMAPAQGFQCIACRHQASLIAGMVFRGIKLPQTIWFLAMCLISQVKTDFSALALSRQRAVAMCLQGTHRSMMPTSAASAVEASSGADWRICCCRRLAQRRWASAACSADICGWFYSQGDCGLGQRSSCASKRSILRRAGVLRCRYLGRL